MIKICTYVGKYDLVDTCKTNPTGTTSKRPSKKFTKVLFTLVSIADCRNVIDGAEAIKKEAGCSIIHYVMRC